MVMTLYNVLIIIYNCGCGLCLIIEDVLAVCMSRLIFDMLPWDSTSLIDNQEEHLNLRDRLGKYMESNSGCTDELSRHR